MGKNLEKLKRLGLIDESDFKDIKDNKVWKDLDKRNEELDKSIEEKYSKLRKEDINYFRYLLMYGKVDFEFSGLDL